MVTGTMQKKHTSISNKHFKVLTLRNILKVSKIKGVIILAKVIVFYFSATNTTKQRAEKVAQKLGADLFEIHAAKPYSVADLDWHDP